MPEFFSFDTTEKRPKQNLDLFKPKTTESKTNKVFWTHLQAILFSDTYPVWLLLLLLQTTALSWVLSNTLAMCKVDRMNDDE